MAEFQVGKSLHHLCLLEGFEYKCKHNIFKYFHVHRVHRTQPFRCKIAGLSCYMYNKYGRFNFYYRQSVIYLHFISYIINSNFTKIHVEFIRSDGELREQNKMLKNSIKTNWTNLQWEYTRLLVESNFKQISLSLVLFSSGLLAHCQMHLINYFVTVK